jgi:hypothetical protein
LTRDCPTGGVDAGHPCTPGGGNCLDGSHVGPFVLNLSPLGTGLTVKTKASGLLCAGQVHPGCFGLPSCKTISETGSHAGPVDPGVAANAILAGVFCIPSISSGLIDAAVDLPGPAAVSLPGTFLVRPGG